MRISLDNGATFIEVPGNHIIVDDIHHFNGVDVFRVQLNDEGVLTRKTSGTPTKFGASMEDYNHSLNNA